MSLPKGYFGIQRLNGYSHTLEDGAIKELVYAVDMWIEKNTGLIACMTVSPEFYGRLKAAVGYDVLVLDTIIGDFLLFVHIDAKTPIQITALDEHIHNSESSDILTPKGSPDFSETSYIRDEVKITCPVVEEAERRKAMIDLKNAMLDGTLLTQIDARRESALQDCDANLAALLYRAKDRIIELENELTVLKRGAQ